jgi:hypothetical protein
MRRRRPRPATALQVEARVRQASHAPAFLKNRHEAKPHGLDAKEGRARAIKLERKSRPAVWKRQLYRVACDASTLGSKPLGRRVILRDSGGRAASKASAAGQYLGYGLQPVRFCYYLLSEPGENFVSLEHLDDIAVRRPDTDQYVLEQTKSALAHNPVTDWGEELWKAFANWLDLLEQKTLDVEKTRFRLYVTPAHIGEWVQRLSDANTDVAADQIVAEISAALDSLTKAPRCGAYLKRFLSSDSVLRRALIRHFTFESIHADPLDALRTLIGVTVPANMVDQCCSYAIGAAKDQVESLIRDQKPPELSAGEFRAGFQAFVRKHDLTRLLPSTGEQPAAEVVQQTLLEGRVFVRQLEIIQMPTDGKLRAISDYLQTSADKTTWADEGYVLRESFAEYDADLRRQYSFIRGEIEDLHGRLDAQVRGRTLYNRCGLVRTQLDGREVPGYFVPGCFNELADKLVLGWHPNFMQLLTAVVS